jgi:rhodanese-related sulfurtransferase
MLWSSSYAVLGYVFSDQLDLVATHVARMGALLALAVAAVFGFFFVKKLVRWLRFARAFTLARITPQELMDKLRAGDDVLIIDLQGHGAHAADTVAIPGAVRIDPWRLEQYKDLEIAPFKDVVLYCASAGELTSVRVALALGRRGIVHVRPLAGGIKGWRERGFPVTAVVDIPTSSAIRA